MDTLWDEAMDARSEGDWQKVVAIGERLLALRHTSGFEVLAVGQLGAEDLRGALATLERGLEVGPQAWRLWQLLGNCRSDLGDPAGARAAYERALACPGVWAPSVELNLAILDEREGRYADALRRAEAIDDDELAPHVTDLRLRLLRRRRNQSAPDAQYLKLGLHVRARAGQRGFFQGAMVVARSAEDALRIVVEDLGPDYAEVEADHVEIVQAVPDALLGIYALQPGRAYYG